MIGRVKSKPLQPKMMLLPPAEGCCRICFVKHEPWQAHNAQSLSYQIRFKMRYGRDGTWADAIAHCSEQVQQHWMSRLRQMGKYTEPPAGIAPISEPIDG